MHTPREILTVSVTSHNLREKTVHKRKAPLKSVITQGKLNHCSASWTQSCDTCFAAYLDCSLREELLQRARLCWWSWPDSTIPSGCPSILHPVESWQEVKHIKQTNKKKNLCFRPNQILHRCSALRISDFFFFWGGGGDDVICRRAQSSDSSQNDQAYKLQSKISCTRQSLHIHQNTVLTGWPFKYNQTRRETCTEPYLPTVPISSGQSRFGDRNPMSRLTTQKSRFVPFCPDQRPKTRF